MKTLLQNIAVVIGIVLGTLILLWLSEKYPVPKPPTVTPLVTLELSVDGENRVFKTSADNTIHVIADDELRLIDIQVLTTENSRTKITSPYKTKYGQQPNQVLSSSSQESQKSP